MTMQAKQLKLSTQCFVQWLLKDNFKSSELLTIDQVPEVMREPHIHTGYRPVYRSWKYYVHSILHLHNETLNIWTHFIGFFIVLFYLAHILNDYDVINDKVAWPVIAFGICSLLSLIISAIAHLLHSKSPWHHHILFMLDYAAIVTYGFGIGVGSIYISSSSIFRDNFHHIYLPASVLINVSVLFSFCTARVKFAEDVERRKRLMIISTGVQGLFLFAPLIPRYTSCLWNPDCSMSSLNHISLVVVLDVFCAVTFAALVPERWMPGRCDLIGHSHQIFHVGAVIAMMAKLSAMRLDINTKDIPRELIPSWTSLSASMFILLLLNTFVFRHFLQCIKSTPSSKKRRKLK